MMMNRLFLFALVALLGSCTALKYVPPEERLYAGADVKVITQQKVSAQGKAVSACEDLIRPDPNKKFLGTRPFLWLYYVTNTKKQKGFKYWLKNKVGEAPVYMSAVDAGLVSRAMDAKLYNIGFFDSYSQFEVVDAANGKTSSVNYKLFLYEPYKYKEIIIPKGKDSLNYHLSQSFRRSLLDTGDRYDLEKLADERVRIDERLKQRGFYYFNADDILFRMDTALGGRNIRMYITIKKDVPEKSKLVYKIADVHVYPDYKLGDDTMKKSNGKVVDTLFYYDETGYIRPEPVIRSVFLKNNTIYNRRRHNLTLNHLNGLGVFKFVNVRIRDKDTSAQGWLTTDIFLTPMPRKSLSLEFQGVSKSNNFIGPGVNFVLRNRNAFKGAEMMIYNIRTSFETQFNGLYKGQYTYEINPRIELYVPRFMVPFKINLNNNFVPRTKYVLDYSYLSRVGYFDMNSFKFTFGYKWKTKPTIDHDLSLVSINYFNIYNTSPGFSDLVRTNILFRRKFEEQFIAGVGYSFFYNQQVLKRKKNQIYFNANAEVAGNTLALYKKVVAGEKATSSDPSKFLGISFAQFGRLDIDVRDYYNLGPKSMFATRFIAGWGLPYGNSSTMPYIKQFFSGGAYSVRGFQAYSIGPGSYSPPDSLKNLFFLQQGGEIRLEANVEYRFPIVSVLRGAFFADAGNVWLNNEDPLIPGGKFAFGSFARDLAVGIGTGLRADLSFFVLRLDLGIPARKPWLPYGERWVFHNIDFGNARWRRENLVLNIAFGYPF